jgi:hypothetical protein
MSIVMERDTPALPRARYVTDGLSLYRVVVPLRTATGTGMAELEDCLTLETRLYTPDELWEMSLRAVANGERTP